MTLPSLAGLAAGAPEVPATVTGMGEHALSSSRIPPVQQTTRSGFSRIGPGPAEVGGHPGPLSSGRPLPCITAVTDAAGSADCHARHSRDWSFIMIDPQSSGRRWGWPALALLSLAALLAGAWWLASTHPEPPIGFVQQESRQPPAPRHRPERAQPHPASRDPGSHAPGHLPPLRTVAGPHRPFLSWGLAGQGRSEAEDPAVRPRPDRAEAPLPRVPLPL